MTPSRLSAIVASTISGLAILASVALASALGPFATPLLAFGTSGLARGIQGIFDPKSFKFSDWALSSLQSAALASLPGGYAFGANLTLGMIQAAASGDARNIQ